MADPLELELKLEFDPADRKALESAGQIRSLKGRTEHLVSTYFDTPGRDLLEAGYSLRVRRNGRKRVQTVKSDGGPAAGLFARQEWEQPIHGDKPRLNGAGEPLALAVGAAALAHIRPLFVTDVGRTTHGIDHVDAAFDLAVDEGEVRANGRAEPISEIELELTRGSPCALFDFARQLGEEVPLRLGVRSKSERGYALAAGEAPKSVKAEPIALDPNGDAADAFAAIARACIRQFRLNQDLLMRTGGVEAVHQARVGLRRLRSAFSLHESLLAKDNRIELFGEEARWLALELGEVRNIDVLVGRLEGDARDQLAAARQRMLGRVRDDLASSRTRLLMIDLAEWLAAGDWRTRPADPICLRKSVVVFAAEILEARRDRLERRGRGLADLDDERRHRVRIEAKKLRYATEFFASLYAAGKAKRRQGKFLDAMEKLQDLLGELNDLAVGPEVLEKLGIEAKLPKAGKHSKGQLLDKAEGAFRNLMKAKPFWRS